MKKFTITTALLLTLLTPASAGFSFMGDMISDMRKAAADMKDNSIDVVRDTKDEMVDAKSSMSDDMKDMKDDISDNAKDLKPNEVLSSNDKNSKNNTTEK